MDFFATVMGHRYYEHTLPRLVEELARLNKNLEALVAVLEHGPPPPAAPAAPPPPATK